MLWISLAAAGGQDIVCGDVGVVVFVGPDAIQVEPVAWSHCLKERTRVPNPPDGIAEGQLVTFKGVSGNDWNTHGTKRTSVSDPRDAPVCEHTATIHDGRYVLTTAGASGCPVPKTRLRAAPEPWMADGQDVRVRLNGPTLTIQTPPPEGPACQVTGSYDPWAFRFTPHRVVGTCPDPLPDFIWPDGAPRTMTLTPAEEHWCGEGCAWTVPTRP